MRSSYAIPVDARSARRQSRLYSARRTILALLIA